MRRSFFFSILFALLLLPTLFGQQPQKHFLRRGGGDGDAGAQGGPEQRRPQARRGRGTFREGAQAEDGTRDGCRRGGVCYQRRLPTGDAGAQLQGPEEGREGAEAPGAAVEVFWICFFGSVFRVRKRETKKSLSLDLSLSLDSPDRLAPYPHEPARLLLGDGPGQGRGGGLAAACRRSCRCFRRRHRRSFARGLFPPAEGRAGTGAQHGVRRPLSELRRPWRDGVSWAHAGRGCAPGRREARGRG